MVIIISDGALRVHKCKVVTNDAGTNSHYLRIMIGRKVSPTPKTYENNSRKIILQV
jgi:hypothetical protein